MATLYFGTTLINQAEANVATVVESLTQAEYAALAVKDPNTLYVLTDVESPVDAHAANKNNPHGVTAAQVGAPTVAQMNAAIAAIPTPDVSGQINDHNTSATAHAGVFAPMYSYGTTDLTAGSSSLESGKLYFVYE